MAEDLNAYDPEGPTPEQIAAARLRAGMLAKQASVPRGDVYGFQGRVATRADPTKEDVDAVMRAIGFSPEFIAQRGQQIGGGIALALARGTSPAAVVRAYQESLGPGNPDAAGEQYIVSNHDAGMRNIANNIANYAAGLSDSPAGSSFNTGTMSTVTAGNLARMRQAAGLDANGYPIRIAPSGPAGGVPQNGRVVTAPTPIGTTYTTPPNTTGAGDPSGISNPTGPGPTRTPPVGGGPTADAATPSTWGPPQGGGNEMSPTPTTPVQRPYNPSAGVQQNAWRPPSGRTQPTQQTTQQPNRRRWGIYF